MFSALLFGLCVQQCAPLDYATTRRHVEYGGSAILYVGVPPKSGREVYGYAASLYGVSPGVYRCYRGANGVPVMVPIVQERQPIVSRILGSVCIGRA